MTAKDYLDRIRKAVSIERLSDLKRWVTEDAKLSASEVKALEATIDQRTLYVATLGRTP